MGKKYLETKKDSLESSVLGVWQNAIEDGEAIRDAAQMTKGVTKEEIELDEVKRGTRKDLEQLEKQLRDAKKKKDKKRADALQKELEALLKSGKGKKIGEEVELDEALPSHLKKFFDKDGNPKSKEGKAAWERLAKMKGFKKYTSKQVKMAIGIAFDKRYVQGNMTGAVNAIEKIAKGLSEIEPVRNALRRANEEVDLDEGKFERDMVTAKGISLQIRIIVTARNMIDDGKSDSEIMKTTKLSAGDVKKLRQDMSDRPGEYDEEAELEEGKMKELHGYIAQGKSAEWIAKKMKVDVEAIKTLMAGYNESYEIGTNEYRGHCEKVTPGEGLDEANYEIKNGKIHISKANFRKVHKDYKNSTKGKERMMALDPKSGATTSYEVVFEAVDPADVDDDATDDDRAAASKNIIHQLRKSIDQDGKFAVTFGDNKKVKIDAKIAKAINDKFMSIKRPPDKVKFQAQAAKSYKDMLKVLKNGFNEEIQKETILDRIDKKLKERKNG